jgi:UDP-glucose 4-epimerase
MKALVSGGAGFIGSHVVDGYVAGGLEVVVVDDLSRGSGANLPPGVPFYKLDIRDRSALGALFEREKPDLINHHAAQIDVRRSVREPVFDAECNILGSLNLLELAVKCKVRRFIYASTGGAIYGEPKILPADEGTPVEPLSPYGISKHSFEHYLLNARQLYGLPFVVLRYGNVYGPRQSSEGEAGVVAIFCEQMLQSITPTIFGDGKKTRDYVEVSDVARANLQALKHGEDEIFNVATGVATTDYEVFAAVRDALGLPPSEPQYAPKRPGEVDHIYLDVRKAASALEWHPKVTFRAGVAKTAEWFRQHLGVHSRYHEPPVL